MGDQEVKIRSLELTDGLQLARLANHKNVWNNLRDSFPNPYHENDAEFFIKGTREENPQHTFCVEFNGEFCGVIGLIPQNDVYRKSAEIGYWLGEPYWGKGIATKAVGLMTNYGFEKLNLIRIYAGIFEYNSPSMRVLEKNGYQEEGISQKAITKNGKIWNEHRYYKLNKQHQAPDG